MNLKTVDVRKLRTCLYGMAVGDALGVPYEFNERGTFVCTDMVGYGTWNQPKGTYSDDTGMALAMLDSIAECGGIDTNDMMVRFRLWFCGEYMPNGLTFDVGNTVRSAIAEGKGMDGLYDNGNGSLMRTAPLALLASPGNLFPVLFPFAVPFRTRLSGTKKASPHWTRFLTKPATSYFPRQSPTKYHQRLRA